MLAAYCFLLTAYCFVPTAYCFVPTAYCFGPTGRAFVNKGIEDGRQSARLQRGEGLRGEIAQHKAVYGRQ